MDWFDLAVQGTLKSLLQHHNLKASILWCSAFFKVQLSHLYMTTGKSGVEYCIKITSNVNYTLILLHYSVYLKNTASVNGFIYLSSYEGNWVFKRCVPFQKLKMSCNLSLLRLWLNKLKQDEPAASVGLRLLTIWVKVEKLPRTVRL